MTKNIFTGVINCGMNILSINPYYKPFVYPANNQKSTGLTFCAKKPVEKDFFELSYQARARQVYSKLNKLTKEEYFALTETEKEFLRSENRLLIEEGIAPLNRDIRIHTFAANAIQKTFDKQFGKGNYVVITIGRSLSSISKALEVKIGSENVKNIPLSSANEFYILGDSFNSYEKSIQSMTSLYGFNKFKQYLASIGLDKKTIETSGKQYIIMDYAASGSSLAGAYTILTSNELLGNKKRNITTASMADITALTSNPIHMILDELLNTCEFKKYSYVDNLYTKLEDITTSADYTKFSNKKDIRLKKLLGFILYDQEYAGKKYTIEDEFDIKAKTVTLPMQNAKIWNSIEKQYTIDVREDVQEIFKIMHTINEPLNEMRYANKKMAREKAELLAKTIKTCDRLFTRHFPLEYQYYKNIQLFEERKDNLPSGLVEEIEPIIKNKYINQNSEIFKLFEKTQSEINELKKHNFFIDDEFSEVVFDNEILSDFVKEISRKHLGGKEFSDYYHKLRPEILEFIEKLSPKYTLEKGIELTKTVKRIAIEKQCQQSELHEEFTDNLLKTIHTARKYPNQTALIQTVEQQNNILKEIIFE